MPTDQNPLTMSAVIEKRPDWLLAWQDYPHSILDVQKARKLNRYVVELEDYLRSEIAAHAETLNERDAARWERDRAISQLAEARERERKTADERDMELNHRIEAEEQRAETLGIARELAESLERQTPKCDHPPDSGCLDCLCNAALAKARAAGILNAPKG